MVRLNFKNVKDTLENAAWAELLSSSRGMRELSGAGCMLLDLPKFAERWGSRVPCTHAVAVDTLECVQYNIREAINGVLLARLPDDQTRQCLCPLVLLKQNTRERLRELESLPRLFSDTQIDEHAQPILSKAIIFIREQEPQLQPIAALLLAEWELRNHRWERSRILENISARNASGEMQEQQEVAPLPPDTLREQDVAAVQTISNVEGSGLTFRVVGALRDVPSEESAKVIDALLKAYPSTLNLTQLREAQRGGNKILAGLARKDPLWRAALHLPGKKGGGGYRIRSAQEAKRELQSESNSRHAEQQNASRERGNQVATK